MKANEKPACSEELRRQTVRNKANGIDYVEVIDDADQTKLCVHFFGNLPEGLKPGNVVIRGGRRIRDIAVNGILARPRTDPGLEACLEVSVDKPGDFSIYTLCLVEMDEQGRSTGKPFKGLDQRYSCADFSFKAGCPSDLDCKTGVTCPPEKKDEPESNYLAKDYASFRQLLLDRLALIMPDWQERHAPDLGITLVELLAYVGDYLSYYQDAVATEAYLDTARERISVRRHARLVDYRLHEGCNARTWVSVETDTDLSFDRRDLFFITRCPELASVSVPVMSENDLQKTAPHGRYEAFEPLLDDREKSVQIFAARSTIYFYTWGDKACCLPEGATKATLRDPWRKSGKEGNTVITNLDEKMESGAPRNELQNSLQPDDILIFEEVKGPKTGNPADVDPTHRHAVRVIKAEPGVDMLYNVPIVEIEWSSEDALPFPLCISSRRDAPDCDLIEDVSVVRGNVVLVDHGRTISEPEPLGIVDTKSITRSCACDGSQVEMTVHPEKFTPPVLKQSPLTFSQPLSPGAPATGLLTQDPRQTLPQIMLKGLPGAPQVQVDETDPQREWVPKYDLLESTGEEQSFVVETDNDQRAHLRFGDNELGKLPEADTKFSATYRVGNGPSGNVGAESIAFLILRKTSLNGVQLRVRNPLPAQGGMIPEPLTEARLRAPYAFRGQLQRAITAEDYASLAAQHRGVQGAGASLQWTGSWYEARVAFDPLGTEEAEDKLRKDICGFLHPYRRMGHDLSVMQAAYVPLLIEMRVCVLPNYLRGHVEAALLDLFSNRVLADGSLGFFHPDKLTFGEGVYLSTLVAAAQAVSGVESVAVTKLERLFEGPNHEIENGILPLGPTEIARLDNDPSFPENGKLTLFLGGGR